MALLALKHKLHGANNDFLQIINFLDVATDQLVTLGKGHGASFFHLNQEEVGLCDHWRQQYRFTTRALEPDCRRLKLGLAACLLCAVQAP